MLSKQEITDIMSEEQIITLILIFILLVTSLYYNENMLYKASLFLHHNRSVIWFYQLNFTKTPTYECKNFILGMDYKEWF